MSVVVRQAVLEDLDDLVPLFDAYRVFHGQHSDPAAAHAFLLARFDHLESVIFVARRDRQAVGFTQLFPAFSSLALKRTLILNDMYVDEQVRGQGVGRALLEQATAHARRIGALRMVLTAQATNTQARKVYEANGWREDPAFAVYYRLL
ncbi:GNAT family N-acetyltransferase [Aquabacterium sp.]|uniref:GNAT family N-acetyltransferase n=1 Tax=Aquabacterium sp. TaxID=1872578 RepID=UPI0037846414